MYVEVYHRDRAAVDPNASSALVKVATVQTKGMNVDDALEYAYRWTNNLDGSWSLKSSRTFEVNGTIYRNKDLNDDVTVEAVLPEINGKTYGHRSTMVGDRLVVKYGLDSHEVREVAMVGFKVID